MEEEILFKGSVDRLRGFMGLYAQRGNLFLTSSLLRFSGSRGKVEDFGVDEVVGFVKFGVNGMGVCLRDGRVERFRLWKRDALIERFRSVKGNLHVAWVRIDSVTMAMGAIGLLLWLASLFISWMIALPTPFTGVPITPWEQLSMCFFTWGVFGLFGSNFFFVCIIIVILLGVISLISRDVCMFGLSGFAGAAISLIIILLIQSQTFSLERPAPFGSIEFLRFQPDVGLLLYIFASIIIFVSGYFGERHALGLPPPPPSTG